MPRLVKPTQPLLPFDRIAKAINTGNDLRFMSALRGWARKEGDAPRKFHFYSVPRHIRDFNGNSKENPDQAEVSGRLSGMFKPGMWIADEPSAMSVSRSARALSDTHSQVLGPVPEHMKEEEVKHGLSDLSRVFLHEMGHTQDTRRLSRDFDTTEIREDFADDFAHRLLTKLNLGGTRPHEILDAFYSYAPGREASLERTAYKNRFDNLRKWAQISRDRDLKGNTPPPKYPEPTPQAQFLRAQRDHARQPRLPFL